MDLTTIITKAIHDTPSDVPRRYIGASSIGRPCERSIWYGFNGEMGEAVPAGLRTSFDIGKRLELLMLDYVEQAGIAVNRAPHRLHDLELPIFQGTPDAIITLLDDKPVVLEIKTAKSSSFNRFKNHGLIAWAETYYAQLQAYMGMGGYERGVLLAINKDSSELHHEWVDFDEIFYQELKVKARRIAEATEAPDKINRSPLYFVCRSCPFKVVCHS